MSLSGEFAEELFGEVRRVSVVDGHPIPGRREG